MAKMTHLALLGIGGLGFSYVGTAYGLHEILPHFCHFLPMLTLCLLLLLLELLLLCLLLLELLKKRGQRVLGRSNRRG